MAEEDDAGEVQTEEPEDAEAAEAAAFAAAAEEPEDAAPAADAVKAAAPAADAAKAAAPAAPLAERNPNHTDAVYDIPVKVSTVLGVASVRVSKLMKLGRGAVIELDRKVGEPCELYVNDRLVARGELTVTDGRLGVIMTEIMRGNIKPGEL